MMEKIYTLFLVFLLLIGCSTTPADEPEPDQELTCPANVDQKGSRLLGMDFLNQTENGSFDGDFTLSQSFGIQFTALHLLWTQIETSPQAYTDPGDALSLLGAFCQANNIKLSLTLRPIDLTGKTVPSDLENTRFNTDEMKVRFKSLLDFVFTKLDPTILTSVQIGNEIDGYDTSGEHADFWSDYGDFLSEMKGYIDTNYAGVKTGFTVTLNGVIYGDHANSGIFEALAGGVDVVGITYYPIKDDFTVKDPSVVSGDFQAMVDKFAGRPIYLQEVGYQTGSRSNSSERKQAQFMCNIFEAWDTHKDRIELINFVRLNDLSKSEAEEAAGPYGIGDATFIEYLETLGLRSFEGSGTSKEGFDVLVSEANKRGWGS